MDVGWYFSTICFLFATILLQAIISIFPRFEHTHTHTYCCLTIWCMCFLFALHTNRLSSWKFDFFSTFIFRSFRWFHFWIISHCRRAASILDKKHTYEVSTINTPEFPVWINVNNRDCECVLQARNLFLPPFCSTISGRMPSNYLIDNYECLNENFYVGMHRRKRVDFKGPSRRVLLNVYIT